MDLLKSRAIGLEKNEAPMRKNHAGRWSSPVAVTDSLSSIKKTWHSYTGSYCKLLYAVAVGRGITCPF